MSSQSNNKTADWSQIRLLTAILLAAAGGFLGIFLMINGESNMVLPDGFIGLAAQEQAAYLSSMVEKGLQPYCTGFGVLLILVGIGYVLLGYKDKTHTNLQNPEDKA